MSGVGMTYSRRCKRVPQRGTRASPAPVRRLLRFAEGVAQTRWRPAGLRRFGDGAELHRVRSRAGSVVAAEPARVVGGGHLAWFVLDPVAEVDLAAIYASYRDDGSGRAAHDPAMMVALFMYAYAIGFRSWLAIERRCYERRVPVITVIRAPITRRSRAFGSATRPRSPTCSARCWAVRAQRPGEGGRRGGRRHQDRRGGHASRQRSYDQIAREILEEAARIDAAEDDLFGDVRGDELPEGFAPAAIAARCSRGQAGAGS